MSQATAAAAPPRTLFGHPLGLYTLFSAELWERFSFYGMRALLILYMTDYFVWSQQKASDLFGWYVALAYATPALGGLIADRWLGAKRAVIVGGVLLSIGHFLMAFEPLAFFYTALGFIVLGVGFLKPNISTQVGSLYKADDPRRDGAFTIFYMGINLGAFMGPIVCGWLRINYGFHYGFAAAGVGMILGLIVYIMGHRMLVEFQQQPDEKTEEEAGSGVSTKPSPRVVRDRVIVLLIVFAFVILFWMAFEQSANVMVVWANKHTNLRPFSAEPPAVSVEPGSAVSPGDSGGFTDWAMGADQTQSINPFFIIVFAPVLAGLWAWLDRRHLQPSTPTKMVVGLLLVAVAFLALVPATSRENGSSSAPLAALPNGVSVDDEGRFYSVDPEEGDDERNYYGATRLIYDSAEHQLTMRGVLPDTERLRLLVETAPKDFVAEFESVIEASKENASEGTPLTQVLALAPGGVIVFGDEAEKILHWESATKTLTVTGEIKKRAEIEFLATAAQSDFKQAIDKVYMDSSVFRISIWWLALHFLLITLGELCLSPVGLSLVTKIAPTTHVGLFMGGWFLATAIAEKIAHIFGGMWGNMTPVKYFMIFVIFCGVGGLLMALLIKPMKRMMHGVH